MIKHKSRCRETASNKPNASTAFNLPSSAATGDRTFAAAYSNADQLPYFAANGTDWESGIGTFATGSPSTITRTAILESSTGSAIDWTAGASVSIFVEMPSRIGEYLNLLMQSVAPGGRLTLTTGVPVTTSDVTAATTIYYTPYQHNNILLWDGTFWRPVIFPETSLPLGTLTSAQAYDVFGYLNAGVLSLELLAWTNSTTRATAVTLQDGRYCKSGDITRLYLGSFYTTSTTTTEDSGGGATTQVGGKRFLWNMYNRVRRAAQVKDTTDSWSYATNAIRQANGNSGNKIELMNGLSEDIIEANVHGDAYLISNGSVAAKAGVGINSTTTFSGYVQGGFNLAASGVYAPVSGAYAGVLSAGYNYISWNEKGAGGTSIFLGDNAGDGQQTGLSARFFA